MSMIFPGMDPYLEEPQIWPGVHGRLIVYVADALQPVLRPRYIASLDERVFVEGPDREIIPDVWLRQRESFREGGAVALAESDAPVLVQVSPLEVHESYVAILDRQSGLRVVTIIEVVSPTNKYAGPGRKSYVDKQKEVLASETHLVEIDLLRMGPHVLAVPEGPARRRGHYDYLTCVNRATESRDLYELYPRRLRQCLPRIRIPLAEGDPDVTLDLQALLAKTYEAGSYRDRIDYTSPCQPPLPADDQPWAEQLIREALAKESPTPPAPG